MYLNFIHRGISGVLPRLLFSVLLSVIGLWLQAKPKQIVVAKDGSGNFKTVQEAVSSVPDNNPSTIVIYIKAGVYKEKLNIASTKTHIKFVGEDVQKTILTYDDYASKKDAAGKDIGTGGSTSVYIRSNDFCAENITFANSSGPVGQAVAVSVGGDRVMFKNCRFLGFQDTIYTFGNTNRQYFYKCYIEGTVDFIFGAATAVFDKCEIFCKKAGYITAASTPQGQQYGYLFLNCKITGNAPPNSFYLGRPWRPYASVAFINCKLPDLIKPEGWHNWGKESNEQTAFYAEYHNKGAGASISKRVKWSRQLNKEQAGKFSISEVFKGWNPKG